MRCVVAVFCCLFLAGCLTTQIDKQWVNQFEYDHNVNKGKWVYEGLRQDQEACQESAFYRARGAFFMDEEEYERLYRKCMEEQRGWRPSGADVMEEPAAKKTP